MVNCFDLLWNGKIKRQNIKVKTQENYMIISKLVQKLNFGPPVFQWIHFVYLGFKKSLLVQNFILFKFLSLTYKKESLDSSWNEKIID